MSGYEVLSRADLRMPNLGVPIFGLFGRCKQARIGIDVSFVTKLLAHGLVFLKMCMVEGTFDGSTLPYGCMAHGLLGTDN